jgi:uncharacterized membrane protein YdjX (TVP38/TMEM64 family)
MLKKSGLAILYLGLAFVIYLFGEELLAWIQQAEIKHIPFTITIGTIMALFPVIPYPVVGGVIGAAYGPLLGGFITWLGSTLASIFMFLIVRYGYQDWGIRILHKYKTWSRITILFEKNAFLTILFARLIPIVPSIVINVYSALSRVSFTSYAIASSLGKAPAMLLFALLGDQFISQPKNIVITVMGYGVFLFIIFFFYNLWTKNNLRSNS